MNKLNCPKCIKGYFVRDFTIPMVVVIDTKTQRIDYETSEYEPLERQNDFYCENCSYLLTKEQIEKLVNNTDETRTKLEDLIVGAKLQIADDCISMHHTNLIDYMGREDHNKFLDLWKQVYDECYFCGDDEECEHFTDPKGKLDMYNELGDFVDNLQEGTNK